MHELAALFANSGVTDPGIQKAVQDSQVFDPPITHTDKTVGGCGFTAFDGVADYSEITAHLCRQFFYWGFPQL